MMRHLAVCAALFCAFQLSAHAGALLPSQEEQDLVTIKTCRDHEVLSSLKSAIDSSLQASSVLARGMHAGRCTLRSLWIDRPAVICSTTVAAKGIRERIVYTVALEGSSYVIKFGGEPGGSKLFPYQLEVRPINMDMPPGALGRLRPVRSDALIQPRRLATLRSTEYHHRHAGGAPEITKRRTGAISTSAWKNPLLGATWGYLATVPCPTPDMVYSLLYPVTPLPRPSSPGSPGPGSHTPWAGRALLPISSLLAILPATNL